MVCEDCLGMRDEQVLVADVCEADWCYLDDLGHVSDFAQLQEFCSLIYQKVEEPTDSSRQAADRSSKLHWRNFTGIQERYADEAKGIHDVIHISNDRVSVTSREKAYL